MLYVFRHKFGFRYWSVRFSVVFIFFILIVVITAQQIAYSTGTDIASRYMDDWGPVIIVAIGFGVVLLAYEVMQFVYAPRKYIRYASSRVFRICLNVCGMSNNDFISN